MEQQNEHNRYFLPELMADQAANHADEMPDIAAMHTHTGARVLDALTPHSKPEDRSEAIKSLKSSLEGASHFDETFRASLLKQHLAATNMRFYHFALEDDDERANEMGDYIVALFQAAAWSDEPALINLQIMLVEQFNAKAKLDYSGVNPRAPQVPNKRANDLLSRLQGVNPGLFADKLRPRMR